ncbi:hypothetical protein QAD02_005256 [Eretmocerus hayati]|uniref:Uncharacterized protein n=1 Tax=Eretmocerus hayati TaxID=131215 RepID=A0ACC2NSC7_9HYME|nr:hypothetical protein QAD02_005256 [Eretmocerus hayati]
MPQNEAELQLYRVMQRASLLSYYDTLLEMGGDDVQQLCDAGEEEFLEIMALVGMASKPLHVRRLQKALQEWLTNPAMFQSPVIAPSTPTSIPATSSPSPSSSVSALTQKKPSSALGPIPFPGCYIPNRPSPDLQQQQQQQQQHQPHAMGSVSAATRLNSPVAIAPQQVNTQQLMGQYSGSNCCPSVQSPVHQIQKRRSPSPSVTPSVLSGFGTNVVQHQQVQGGEASLGSVAGGSPSPVCPGALASSVPVASQGHPHAHSPGLLPVTNYESSSCGSQGTTPSPGSNHCASSMNNAPQSPTTCMLQIPPVLLESQVQRLAEAAERLATSLRPLNPKPPSGIKKKMCKNLEMVMAMPDSDPRRMEEIRKYAAIYGRFDCKRKPEKPLTLHELSVNEAAAQICRFVPALLTRRDELFPLARRVVRDSGHYYTKGLSHSSCHSSSPRPMSSRENGDGDLSGGDDSLQLPGSIDAVAAISKRRKLDLRGSADTSMFQAESMRLNYSNYNRGAISIDSDSNSAQAPRNRHRKRHRRRRDSKIGRKSRSSPVWRTNADSEGNVALDRVVAELDDSDGCYSSLDDEWDDCNNDGCENNFDIDSDDAEGDENFSGPTSLIRQDSQGRSMADEDDTSCMDKENDFNLKVIASCGDNIIAVANPALMDCNQSSVKKEQPIKEEITLRDRRD